MIQLKINNQVAQLAPNTSIDITENRNAFNLTSVEGTFSVPFDLPLTDANQALFGFVNFPSSQTDFATEYDASIDFSGAIQLEGKFILRSVERTFNGYFKTDSGVLSAFSNTDIRTLITDTYTVERADIPTINADTSSNFYFPRTMDLVERDNPTGTGTIEQRITYNPDPDFFGNTSERYKITIRVKHIITLAFEALGFTAVYDFADSTFDDLIWIPRNDAAIARFSQSGVLPPVIISDFPKTWALNEIVPNMTINELLTSIRVNFNLKVNVDADNRQVIFQQLAQEFDNSIDLSPYTVPLIKLEPLSEEEETSATISFSVPNQNNPEDFENLTPVRRYSDAVASLADLNKVIISEFDCYYYQCVQLRLEPLGNYEYVPFSRNTVGKEISGLTADALSKLSPIPTADFVFRNFTGISLVNNGSGKVRVNINGGSYFGTGAVNNTQMRIIDFEDNPYDPVFVDILAVGNAFIDLDLIYTSDVTADLQSRQIGLTDPQPFLRNDYAEDAQGGVSIYHGIRNTTDNASTYAYASASVYDTDYTTELSNSSLIIDTDTGIFNKYYKVLVDLIGTNIKLGKFTSWLPLDVLLKRKANFVIVKGIRYLISQFKFKLNNRSTDRVKADIQGRIT